jgi:hypothetical protein
MKKLLVLFMVAFGTIANAQNPGYVLLKKINGVDVYYKKSKTKEGDKKDTWVIEFEFNNNSDKDIYYKSQVSEPGDIDKILGDKDNKEIFHFARISIENAKKLSFVSDSNMELSGDKTRLSTDQKENIYIIKKGKTYTKNMGFRADKGIDPVMSLQIINSISFTNDITDFQ